MDDQLIIFLLIGVAVAALGVMLYVFVAPYLTGERQGDQRMAAVTQSKGSRIALRTQENAAQSRRKQVAETLKELDDRQKAREKVSLRLRLQRAGLAFSPNSFWMASGVTGAVLGVFVLFMAPTMPIALPIAAAFIGTLGVPRWILSKLIARRQKKFLAEFANSIDIIVRGVKSGLPLNECLNIIARESPDPIGPEFKTVIEESRVGVTLGESFARMITRVPLPEVRFFAIVISIQQAAGGNLSEALGNLSGVLRDRRTMQMKVKALAAEAKASAMVLASLPFLVMLLVYLTTPAYIGYLFNRTMGNFLLAGAAMWMTCGLLVMRKMINFKY